MNQPKVTWKYCGPEKGELALFWINPWLNTEEKIATFWWPAHPPAATEEAEKLFEGIAQRACIGGGLPVDPKLLAERLGDRTES